MRKAAKSGTKRQRDELERALCALADHEGDIIDAMKEGADSWTLSRVCEALSKLIDNYDERRSTHATDHEKGK